MYALVIMLATFIAIAVVAFLATTIYLFGGPGVLLAVVIVIGLGALLGNMEENRLREQYRKDMEDL
jgi:hypothetical protein